MTLTPFSNQREFIRLDSVFPVEFQFLSSGGKLEELLITVLPLISVRAGFAWSCLRPKAKCWQS